MEPGGPRLIHETSSLCRRCKNVVPARVVETGAGEAWMLKECPEHGSARVKLAADAGWYERTRATPSRRAAPTRGVRPLERGCPFDCGPCEGHAQGIRLPIVSITSACNLACPICYVHNKNEDPFHMSVEELGRILDRLDHDHDGSLDLINLTGGEPTMHPDLPAILERCVDAGIERVSVCTNGIRLAEDERLVETLASLGVRVALSFQSFEEDADFDMQGAHLVDVKLRCLDLLEARGVDTTLIPVMTRGVNDHEIGRILRMGLARSNVRHVEVHTMTFTGQYGVRRDRGGRITIDEVLTRIEETTGGLLRPRHFVPSPCAHPLCYQVAYLLLDPQGGPPIPFLDFVTPEEMRACLSDHLYLEPGSGLEGVLRGAIDRLWADGGEASERLLALLKALLGRMFPRKPLSRAEALRVGERAAKAVYVHSHMDEETFDVQRVARCCDSGCYADGSSIPICSYNVLYRDKEPRYAERPGTWDDQRAGHLDLPLLGTREGPGSCR